MTNARILISDDEANIRLMLARSLESEGYHIDQAANGEDALELIAEHRYRLMLLDLNMPVVDGMTVLARLKGMPEEERPRVIVLTAYGSISAAVKAIRLGAMDFIEKPVTPDELRKAVSHALASPSEARLDEMLKGGYAAVLDRVRSAMSVGAFTDAETLLMKAADLGEHDACYYNLLGVLYEVQNKWNLARKFYGKAMRADNQYQPAQQNMRRIFELYQFGQTRQAVALGDPNWDEG